MCIPPPLKGLMGSAYILWNMLMFRLFTFNLISSIHSITCMTVFWRITAMWIVVNRFVSSRPIYKFLRATDDSNQLLLVVLLLFKKLYSHRWKFWPCSCFFKYANILGKKVFVKNKVHNFIVDYEIKKVVYHDLIQFHYADNHRYFWHSELKLFVNNGNKRINLYILLRNGVHVRPCQHLWTEMTLCSERNLTYCYFDVL